MSEPQAARPTQHVSEKALEDLDHNVIEPPPVPRRDIPEGAGKVVFVGAGPGAPDLVSVRGCLLYTSPSPRDGLLSRMPSSA